MPESLTNITAEPPVELQPAEADNYSGQQPGHEYNPSLTSFSPEQEARFFLRLLLHGAVTYKRACDAIEMRPYQKAWLIQNEVAKRHQIELLFDKRQQTLRLFETMAREYVNHG